MSANMGLEPHRHPHAHTGAVRYLLDSLAMALMLAYWAVVGTTYTLIGVVLNVVLPRRLGARIGRTAISAAFRAQFWLMRITGLMVCDMSALDALNDERGLIIAPNHPSMLDAVFVVARVADVACVMKASIQNNLALGGGARLARYICNDSNTNMVRSCVAELRAGSKVLLFPEGTRTTKPPINEFKGAFSLIARKSGAPVQTVFIEADTPYLGKGWPVVRRPDFPLVFRIRLGKRFTVGHDSKDLIADLEAYFRAELGPPHA